MTKQIIRIGIAVLTSLLALVVLWQFRVIIAYILISVMLAAALRPLANRLVGRKLIVRIAWILLYVLVLGGFIFIIFLTGKVAITEVQDFGAGLSNQGRMDPADLVGGYYVPDKHWFHGCHHPAHY